MKRTVLAVLLLTLPLAACSGSSAGSAADSTAAPAAAASGAPAAQTFLLRGNDQDVFEPQRFAAKVGTLELTLQNGGVPHNVTFDDASLTGIPTISGAERKSTTLTFTKPGTYTFVCTIHSGMDGAIVVS
ncbi:MAG: plastocyanin/azurin family copper-binding protein [Mycobacteriales bacterium]